MYYKEYNIEELEKQRMKTFLQIHPSIAIRNISLQFVRCYLYHGIN